MNVIIDIFQSTDAVFSREDLCNMTGRDDRTIRNNIADARELGIPIVPVKTGGYKMAKTEDEKAALLHLYRKRALKELYLYNRLAREMQVPGQLKMEEVFE